jgi:hypothetical protein
MMDAAVAYINKLIQSFMFNPFQHVVGQDLPTFVHNLAPYGAFWLVMSDPNRAKARDI